MLYWNCNLEIFALTSQVQSSLTHCCAIVHLKTRIIGCGKPVFARLLQNGDISTDKIGARDLQGIALHKGQTTFYLAR